MSLSFDLVINCELREDISADGIQAIHCLTDPRVQLEHPPQLLVQWTPQHPEENVWNYFSDLHFLAHDPAEEVISNFSRKHRATIPLENNREVYRYVLQYCGRRLQDDIFYHHHIPFLYWLATVAHDPCIGYYRETYDNTITPLTVINQSLLWQK